MSTLLELRLSCFSEVLLVQGPLSRCLAEFLLCDQSHQPLSSPFWVQALVRALVCGLVGCRSAGNSRVSLTTAVHTRRAAAIVPLDRGFVFSDL